MYHAYKGDMEIVQRALHARLGPIVRIAPHEVSVADPSAIPKVYRATKPLQKTDYYLVYRNTDITKQPDMFTSIDEVEHANYRKIVNAVYLMSSILKSEDKIDECTTLFLKRLGEHADENADMDLGEWLEMYAYDVIGEVFFGRKFGFLEKSCDHGNYIASLDVIMPVLNLLGITPKYCRTLVLLSSMFAPAVLKAVMAVSHMQKEAIAIADSKKVEVEETERPRVDVLSQLFQIVKDKGEKVKFGHKEATNEAYTGILAGADSTAIELRACFYYLMRIPTALAKLLAEIKEADAAGTLSSPIKFSEAKRLPYLCACVKEACRLFPSVALGMQRHPPAEGMELCGKYIPSAYRVSINPAVVHYDKHVFGDDAQDFRPERWIEATEEQVRAMDRAMLVFGAGTRTCTGQNIPLAQMHKLLPEVLRRFNVQMAHDQPWKTRNSFFIKQSDMIVKVSRRTG
ncbi:cytochrome P450 [Polyplosphaeria fusca]|uniref:Cytochrome P450 n=1 Tax=Polyplosphaeria fusca TaxID=682080 RepID=A0A9P4QN97_9PLEO|nr:cytochrome P450 [Polyplosphaeria fusca]